MYTYINLKDISHLRIIVIKLTEKKVVKNCWCYLFDCLRYARYFTKKGRVIWVSIISLVIGKLSNVEMYLLINVFHSKQ